MSKIFCITYTDTFYETDKKFIQADDIMDSVRKFLDSSDVRRDRILSVRAVPEAFRPMDLHNTSKGNDGTLIGFPNGLSMSDVVNKIMVQYDETLDKKRLFTNTQDEAFFPLTTTTVIDREGNVGTNPHLIDNVLWVCRAALRRFPADIRETTHVTMHTERGALNVYRVRNDGDRVSTFMNPYTHLIEPDTFEKITPLEDEAFVEFFINVLIGTINKLR